MGRLIRVQVKSTLHRWREPSYNYVVDLRHTSGQRYAQSEFDFLAMYVIPRDVWYIIPTAVAARRIAIHVCPGNKRNQYERYREAWHLLRDEDGAPPKGQRGVTLHAMTENYPSLPILASWVERHD